MSAESGKSGLQIVGWMTEREQDATFPRFHRKESEANDWVKFCTVGPRITVRPIYAIDPRSSDPVRAALVEALTNVESSLRVDDHGDWYLSSDFDLDKLYAALRAAGVEP